MARTSASPAQIPTAVLKAAGWMCGAVASFTLVAITGREAARGLTTPHLMFYRSWFALIVVLLVALALGRAVSGWQSKQPKLQCIRSIVHFGAQYSWLYALPLIPLAELTALEFTAPLWTAVLAPLLIRERLTPPRIAAVVLGFIGTLLVVRPTAATLSSGTIYGVLAAIGFALHFIGTRVLTRTDGPLTLLLYMTGTQALISTLIVLAAPVWPGLQTALWALGLAVAGLGAHYSLIRAFSLADAILVAPMDFLRLPIVTMLGTILYAEPLVPLVLAGGGLVLVANFINMWGERRAR
jgi:drug/metabolite transporter (DMT)-like permease